MNRKISFIIILAILVLISQTAVSAGDNATSDDKNADIRISIENDISDDVKYTDFPITYTISLENKGSTVETTQTYTRLNNLEYISHSTDNGFYDVDSKYWNVKDLKPGENATLILDTKTANNENVFLSINAVSESGNGNTTYYYVIDNPKINFAQSDVKVTAERTYIEISPKIKTEFKITVENLKGISYNTTLNFKIPEEIDYLNFKISAGTFDRKKGIWYIGNLEKNQKETLTITLRNDDSFHFNWEFLLYSDSYESYYHNNILVLTINVIYPPSSITKKDDVRDTQQRSYYSASAYSDYRQLTEKVNHTVEAKLEEKPTSNPITMIILSLAGCIGIGFRKKQF